MDLLKSLIKLASNRFSKSRSSAVKFNCIPDSEQVATCLTCVHSRSPQGRAGEIMAHRGITLCDLESDTLCDLESDTLCEFESDTLCEFESGRINVKIQPTPIVSVNSAKTCPSYQYDINLDH